MRMSCSSPAGEQVPPPHPSQPTLPVGLVPSTWTETEVSVYLTSKGHNDSYIQIITSEHKIDGKALLLLTEIDLRDVIGIKALGDLKRLMYDILELQGQEKSYRRRISAGGSNFMFDSKISNSTTRRRYFSGRSKRRVTFESSDESQLSEDEGDEDDIPSDINERSPFGNSNDTGSASPASNNGGDGSPPLSTNGSAVSSHRYIRTTSTAMGYAIHLKPQLFKAVVAMAYLFVVTWITALVMVIVHDRVPDMEKYPPLPDLFLDNMPHIPWAFEMCEVTGTILLCLWLGVLFFHKHRFILIRRFFALSGTVFLLRCVTMLITSLSVPGTHLKCNPRPYGDWMSRLYNAYLIWKGAGMSIQGVRTCGDYMFSGHTVALTMLNFFVTEYTTRRLYFIHTFSWLLNMFGIFFILAAHEHYSIDVFIAFYITSRLFLYYHTLANNQALMQRDSKRTKVWFPLFSYFESSVDGIVPNLYEWPITARRVSKLFKTVSLAVERNYKGNFFTREGSSRGFGLFRTRVNAFIRPSVVSSGNASRDKNE